MWSREPVSSPTPTMWTTMAGDTDSFLSGAQRLPPRFTDSVTLAIARSMLAFPAVLPVISIAWSIGTPAEIRPEKVRDQRARATFWTTSPILAGMRSLNASHWARPASDDFHLRNAKTVDPTTIGSRNQ